VPRSYPPVVSDVAQLAASSRFRAERAVLSPAETVWTVIDERWTPHVEACAYLASLRAMDRSPNTERVYAGRVALFLNYCQQFGVDWHAPSFGQLHQFLRWLVTEPVVQPGKQHPTDRLRSKGTANAIVTTTAEFLRFGAKHGWVAAAVPGLLSQPKFLRYAPPGFNDGEDGQYRTVQERTIKFRVSTADPEALSHDQTEAVLAATDHARDRFLVTLLLETGVRIGEALGAWRQDLHFLARSEALGCQLPGPHIHVQRRMNANGALAKSRYPRSIPVTDQTVDAYADYQYERDRFDPSAASDAVFVNLFRDPRGRAMSYANTKEMFDRLGRACGFPVRPHMFRHTAATRWLEDGVAPDVVQALLGHVSFASTSIYLHASRERMRDAVERAAATRAGVAQ
jgi:integrase/recombinase XerD